MHTAHLVCLILIWLFKVTNWLWKSSFYSNVLRVSLYIRLRLLFFFKKREGEGTGPDGGRGRTRPEGERGEDRTRRREQRRTEPGEEMGGGDMTRKYFQLKLSCLTFHDLLFQAINFCLKLGITRKAWD